MGEAPSARHRRQHPACSNPACNDTVNRELAVRSRRAERKPNLSTRTHRLGDLAAARRESSSPILRSRSILFCLLVDVRVLSVNRRVSRCIRRKSQQRPILELEQGEWYLVLVACHGAVTGSREVVVQRL